MIKTKSIAAVAVALSAANANADLLLIIDLSVPNQLTIIATSGEASASVSGTDFTGVLLADFFLGEGTGFLESGGVGNLAYGGDTSDGTPAIFRSPTSTGLNVWSLGGTGSFTENTVAFTGSATWTVDAIVYAEMLSSNTFGDIYAPADSDDDIPTATLIGRWGFIPAPSSLALLSIGGLLASRRRR
jgi:hypothetical protein